MPLEVVFGLLVVLAVIGFCVDGYQRDRRQAAEKLACYWEKEARDTHDILDKARQERDAGLAALKRAHGELRSLHAAALASLKFLDITPGDDHP